MHAARTFALASLLSAPLSAQSFTENTSDTPQDGGDTEQFDFADVDRDGDWDAAVARGGDFANGEQNELWINQGGLSGGTLGVFLDESATRFPTAIDNARDVEFADIDSDGDEDLFIARHASFSDNGSAWWVNLGGKQGGTLGFYADDTAARFLGLGGPGSSVPSSLVLPSGGFIDWTSDADFADLDSDGDLDLVNSSYGAGYAGTTPTRMFLNDGDGRFTEFNPSGFQLTGSTIADGDPALWCNGAQQSGTSDVTGAFADISDPVVDLEVADIDGDFDLDTLWSPTATILPRYFENLSEQGALAFQDLSASVFPGLTIGGFVYEQELGDVDSDGDLDLLGLNYVSSGFSFEELIILNQGGTFLSGFELAASSADDEEADFIDYDNDGDLDLFVANFSGTDKLYENVGTPPEPLVPVTDSELPTGLTQVARDCEVADVDGDGDYDIFVANAQFQPDNYVENITGVPDTTAPYVPNLESLSDSVSAAGARRVRAHVYDNAPLYNVWYYPTTLEVDVDGVTIDSFPMTSSRGQVFRGEIPANLVGLVEYRVRSVDRMGNVGVSADDGYASIGTAGSDFGAASGPSAPTLRALAAARTEHPLYLLGEGAPNEPVILGVSLGKLDPAVAIPSLPNLLLNIDPSAALLTESQVASLDGESLFAFDLPAGGAGVTLFLQLLELGPTGIESSLGLELPIL